MKKRYFKFLIIIFTFSFSIFNFSKPAYGQISLVVSPPKVNLELNPGDTAQQVLKITNDANQPITLKLSVQDFIVQDDQGTPLKITPEEAGRYVASPWFNLDQHQLTIQPQKTATVTVLITTPPDALAGGHYAAVYVEPQQGSKPKTTGPKVVSQIGSLFNLLIKGDIQYDAQITQFRTKKRFYEFGPVDFSAKVQNLSDTHISPKASIVISNMLGQTIDTLTLDQVNIFPYTSRYLQTTWEKVWGLGKYQATLTIPYGAGQVATSTIFFWIVPWRLIAAIILIFLVALVIFILVRRHLQHKHDQRDEEIDLLKRRIAELENNR